jgi:hypothetical protein
VQHPDDIAHDMVAAYIADMKVRSAEQQAKFTKPVSNGHAEPAADLAPAPAAGK